jgi:hypothetical protein
MSSEQLKDGSEESIEFREQLKSMDLDILEQHLGAVLARGSDGKVLQDIVNALGFKIGFNVEFGLYQGKKGSIGFDGYWWLPNIHLIVECKTTDAYRINTKTLQRYAKELAAERKLEKLPDILLVVGRIDTGDIEAQIRGSRMDDRISVIGADSLLDFARTIGELAGGPATNKLRRALIPQDHTRLDELSSLISEVVYETKQMANSESMHDTNAPSPTSDSHAGGLENDRQKVLSLISADFGELKPVPRTRNRFISDANGQLHVIFLSSRRHRRKDQQYWYSLPKNWVDLIDNDEGIVVLHRENDSGYYEIPWGDMQPLLTGLNLSPSKRGGSWHVGLRDTNGRVEILLPRLNTSSDLHPFRRNFS